MGNIFWKGKMSANETPFKGNKQNRCGTEKRGDSKKRLQGACSGGKLSSLKKGNSTNRMTPGLTGAHSVLSPVLVEYLQDYELSESNVVITQAEADKGKVKEFDPEILGAKVFKSFFLTKGDENAINDGKRQYMTASPVADLSQRIRNTCPDIEMTPPAKCHTEMRGSTGGRKPNILIEMNEQSCTVGRPFTLAKISSTPSPIGVTDDHLFVTLKDALQTDQKAPSGKFRSALDAFLSREEPKELTIYDSIISSKDLESLAKEEISEKLVRVLLMFVNNKYKALGTMGSELNLPKSPAGEYYGDKIYCFMPEVGAELLGGMSAAEVIKKYCLSTQKDSCFSFFDKILIPIKFVNRWYLVKIGVRRKLINNNILDFSITLYSPHLRPEISIEDVRSVINAFILLEYISFNNNKVYKERIKTLLQNARFKVVCEAAGPDGSALVMLRKIVSLINTDYQEQLKRSSITTFFLRLFNF
eukprot:TRINITY_DN12815_c0_g3_i1.p1 TRINITY_DN12815_c0_g3~~TRINITY_DN12815_c0_g3_i1.p1  ORF type:complete len:486 (-),score=69.57 TRINITY_DN12815_c0_g3_i1:180-1601(-)